MPLIADKNLESICIIMPNQISLELKQVYSKLQMNECNFKLMFRKFHAWYCHIPNLRTSNFMLIIAIVN